MLDVSSIARAVTVAALVALMPSCGSDRYNDTDTGKTGDVHAIPDKGGFDPGWTHQDLVVHPDILPDVHHETMPETQAELPPLFPMPDTPGEMVITEFMAQSQGGSDKGEWVEVFNATADTLDLGGCILGDDGSDNHEIQGPVELGAGEYLVMARSDEPEENHGLSPDYLYDGFIMSNSGDEIVLTCGGQEIDRVAFIGSWVTEGVSTQLSSTAFDVTANNDIENWCAATMAYGSAGKLGTPGEANEECPVFDPCDPNPCTDLPAPECDEDGVTLITYQTPAPCTVEEKEPVCGEYPPSLMDCSDNDEVCLDGTCTPAALPQPGVDGDILVTEFMAKSQGGSDKGEWVEMYNATDKNLDLGGCVLGDDGSDAHTIIGPLVVPSGNFSVLARSGDPEENHGLEPDYVYSGFQFANTGDEIVLTCGEVEIDKVAYTGAWVTQDKSTQLDPDAFDTTANDDIANWCEGSVEYGSAQKLGTPGAQNVECSTR